jgi:hypothetical protein
LKAFESEVKKIIEELKREGKYQGVVNRREVLVEMESDRCAYIEVDGSDYGETTTQWELEGVLENCFAGRMMPHGKGQGEREEVAKKVIIISTNSDPCVKDLPNLDIHTVGREVGGCIEQVWPCRLSPPYLMVVNEEGRLTGLPVNPVASYLYGTDTHGVPVVGNAVILREYQNDWAGLRESDIDALLKQLERAEAQIKEVHGMKQYAKIERG